MVKFISFKLSFVHLFSANKHLNFWSMVIPLGPQNGLKLEGPNAFKFDFYKVGPWKLDRDLGPLIKVIMVQLDGP